jgi:hypothetical protein
VNPAAGILRPGGYVLVTAPNALNFSHWTQDALKDWGLQPIKNWLTTKQLRLLLEPRFEIKQLRTIISGHATEGLFRLTNSPKLNYAIRSLGLASSYGKLQERLSLGLHIFVIAERV